jgi:methionyl-tRNA formyltransferase
MRIGWVGAHSEGLAPLRALLQQNAPVVSVLTLDPAAAATMSGAADYEPLCREFAVDLRFIRDINDEHSRSLLRNLCLDVAFVIGWTQLVRRETMDLVPGGMIGAHASLLPRLRGRAPINWALIKGLQATGNSLIWLADGADRGDIIDQTVIPISVFDTCESLYDEVARSTTEMILRCVPRLLRGERPGQPQPAMDEPDLPRRRPRDGVMNWARPSREVYDFIRALTRPYPGAWSWLDGRRYRIWQAALLPSPVAHASACPGEIVGSLVSPRPDACGIVVACKEGDVALLEIEDDDGRVLTGTNLANLSWSGKRWSTH